MLEEIYKILRQGAATATFQRLHETGLLAYIMPEADAALSTDPTELLASLARLDIYRNAGRAQPDELTNPLIMGALLVPLGLTARRAAKPRRSRGPKKAVDGSGPEPEEDAVVEDEVAAELEALGETETPEECATIVPLSLPFARRDFDRLRLMLAAQRRLRDAKAPLHARRILSSRNYFPDSLRWAEMQGGEEGRAVAAAWRGLGNEPERGTERSDESAGAPRRRRPRRRGRRRRGPRPEPQVEG